MPTTAPPRTDQAALLASVLAKPEDDAPRLVLADWYDEHGQGERAEFVRVQCKIAECGPVEPHFLSERARASQVLGRDWEAKYKALREREWALWNTLVGTSDSVFKAGSLSGLTPLLCNQYLRHEGGNLVIFSRGFLAEVRLTTAAFLGGPCGACDGVGDDGGRADAHAICPACDGKGDVPGLAAALFAAHPVERVVLTDREPDAPPWGGNERAWHGPPGLEGFWTPHRLPQELFDLVPGFARRTDESPAIEVYPSADAAHAALSAACVLHGRAAAGFG